MLYWYPGVSLMSLKSRKGWDVPLAASATGMRVLDPLLPPDAPAMLPIALAESVCPLRVFTIATIATIRKMARAITAHK